jgi:hypothetical protein
VRGPNLLLPCLFDNESHVELADHVECRSVAKGLKSPGGLGRRRPTPNAYQAGSVSDHGIGGKPSCLRTSFVTSL